MGKYIFSDGEGWLGDEVPVLLFPDNTLREMEQLLALLTTGSVERMRRSELARLVSLTHTLKLVSIPVALSETAPAATNSVKKGRRSSLSPPPSVKSELCRAVISYVPAASAALPKGGRQAGRSLPKAAPPNILLPGGGGGDVRTIGGDKIKLQPLLLPTKNDAAASTVETAAPVFVSLSNDARTARRQISLQQVVIVDPTAASEIFLPHNSMLTLSDSDRHGEFDVEDVGVVDNDNEEDNNNIGFEEDADDDDEDVGNESSDIEEIEIFLNGNGEVVRMEVSQQNLHEDGAGAAACLSAADLGELADKAEFSAASIDEAAAAADETASRDQSFGVDLGERINSDTN
jgi:hypothetical protein